MKKFIYTPLTAVSVVNPSYFDFLYDEKFRYTMPDLVFKNSLIFEGRKYGLDTEILFPINLESEWDSIKEAVECGKQLKEMFSPSEVVYENGVIVLDGKIFFKGLNGEVGGLSSEIIKPDYNKMLGDYIETVYEYLKPDNKKFVDYFINIYNEKGWNLNYGTVNNAVEGIGIKIEGTESLYYNKLSVMLHDITKCPDMFRDYQIMEEVIEYDKENNLDLENQLSSINKQELFHNICEQYIGYNETETYFWDSCVKATPQVTDYTDSEVKGKFWIMKGGRITVSLFFDLSNFLVRIPLKIKVEIY